MKNNTKKFINLLLLFSISGCSFLSNNTSSNNSSSVTTSSTTQISSSSTSKNSSVITSSSSVTSSTSSSSSSLSSTTETSSSSSSTSSSSSSSKGEYIASEKEVNDAIELALENKTNVKKGSLYYKTSAEKKFDYEFGVDKYGDFVRISDKTTSTITDTYYGYDASNQLYGLNVKNNSLSSTTTVDEGYLNGPLVSPYSSSKKYYGAEELLEFTYDLLKENKNCDYLILPTTEGYKYTVGYVEISSNKPIYYVSTVNFNTNDNILSSLSLTVEKYTNTSTTTNVISNFVDDTYYLADNAKPSTSYTVNYTQEKGSRNASNPYDIETYLFTSFDLIDENQNVVNDTLTLKQNKNSILKVSNFLPSSALVSVDRLSVKIVEGSNVFTSSYNKDNGTITFEPTKLGQCVIEIRSKKVTKTLNLTVIEPDPTELSIYYYTESGSSYDFNMCSENIIDTYVNTKIYIKGNIKPTNALQNIGVAVVDGDSNNVETEKTTIEANIVHNVVKTVFKAKGTYVIKVYALANENVFINITVNVLDTPDVSSLLNERYITKSAAGTVATDVNFIPSSEDPSKGKVTIFDSYEPKDARNKEYNYEYNADTRKFTLSNLDNSNSEIKTKLEFTAKYELIYTRPSSGVEVQLIKYSPMVLVAGEWSGIVLKEGTIIHAVTLLFHNNGSGTFSYSKTDNFSTVENYTVDIEATGVENGDEISVVLTEGSLNKIYESKKVTSLTDLVFTGSRISCKIVFNNTEYALDLTKGG